MCDIKKVRLILIIHTTVHSSSFHYSHIDLPGSV